MRTRMILAAVVALAAATPGRDDATAASRGPGSSRTPPAAVAAGAAAPAFLENGGRLPAAVDFTLDARDRTFFFGAGGVTISLRDAARPERGRWVMRLAPEGARDVRPVAEGERPGVTHFLTGPKEAWRAGLRSFERLVWRDLWPGIDFVWRAEPGRLKWECDVHAGADPSAIAFALQGAERLDLGGDGALTASTPLGDFVDSAPVAWQTAGGREIMVDAAFRLDAAAGRIGFVLGAYDGSRDLVIDPSTVVRSAFVGGGLDDGATALAVDSLRNVYVAGTTRSPEATFPAVTGPDVTFNGGADDAFVVKLDASFRVVWSGYLGGSSSDGAAAVAVDAGGAVHVAGYTLSPNFPIVGPLGAVRGGGYDAFVTRITSSGRSITWSAVFGGAGEDRALALAVDRNGRAVVAGRTAGGMPWGTGFGGGPSDAFAMGVHGDGTFLDWGAYLGGGQADSATGVALDFAGNVYLCGDTNSPEASFPVTGGPDLVQNGAEDAWVAKLDALNHLVTWAGYVGGAGADVAAGIAVDSLGRAYVAGSTTSDESTFPVRTGPHLVHHGKSDAYVARVAADGTSLEYCGFVGGSGDDFAYGVALDASRRACVVGTTGSTEKGYPGPRSKFPVVRGSDVTFNGGVHDGWIGVVQPDGSQMTSLGYLGGKSNIDDATAVALHSSGDVFVAGGTASPPKTFPSGTGAAPVARGARDAFAAQLQLTPPAPLLLVPVLDAVAASGFDVNVDWTDADPNESGHEVERTAADGTSARFSIASPAGAAGPVRFTDTTAAPGAPYAYRVRGVDANGEGEFSECAAVTTTPSLELKLRRGSINRAGTDAAGVAGLRLKYAFQPGSATSSLDPVADGISITISGAGADQTLTVLPNDPEWIVTGNVSAWMTLAAGATRIVVDADRRTIRLDATALTFAGASAQNAVRVSVRCGGSFGVSDDGWRGTKSVRYRYP